MEHRSLSPETLAAQALGEADPASGGLAPVINPSSRRTGQADVGFTIAQYAHTDPQADHQVANTLAG